MMLLVGVFGGAVLLGVGGMMVHKARQARRIFYFHDELEVETEV
jgi:hypothetical protein